MSVETRVERQQLKDIARRVLDAMPVRDREVLIRFYLRQERPEEVQCAMEITQTQFRLAKSRAKARFGELCRAATARQSVKGEAGRHSDHASACSV